MVKIEDKFIQFCMNQMLLRSIVSSSLRHQSFPNFWIRRNGLITAKQFLPSNLERKPLDKGYVLSYLVDSCGLSQKKAIYASNLVHFDGPDKPDSVVNFLKKQGFSQDQITDLVGKFPRILLYDPQKSIGPRFEFLLRSTGISEAELPKFVLRHPGFLKNSFEHKVAPAYDYVKSIIGGEKADRLLRRGSWLFNLDVQSRIVPNVNVLREIGVAQQFIEFAISSCPNIFFGDHVKLKRVAEEVKDMGFDPLKSSFVLAIKARLGEGSVARWDRCSEVYSGWGWSEEDIHLAYTTHPGCMLLSEKKISAAMDYLVNKLGRESRSIARCPQILSYSMEKRIVPRCSIMNLVFLEGLIEKDWCLTSVVAPVEETFVEKYVMRYIEEMPQLYDIYLSKKGSGVCDCLKPRNEEGRTFVI